MWQEPDSSAVRVPHAAATTTLTTTTASTRTAAPPWTAGAEAPAARRLTALRPRSWRGPFTRCSVPRRQVSSSGSHQGSRRARRRPQAVPPRPHWEPNPAAAVTPPPPPPPPPPPLHKHRRAVVMAQRSAVGHIGASPLRSGARRRRLRVSSCFGDRFFACGVVQRPLRAPMPSPRRETLRGTTIAAVAHCGDGIRRLCSVVCNGRWPRLPAGCFCGGR